MTSTSTQQVGRTCRARCRWRCGVREIAWRRQAPRHGVRQFFLRPEKARRAAGPPVSACDGPPSRISPPRSRSFPLSPLSPPGAEIDPRPTSLSLQKPRRRSLPRTVGRGPPVLADDAARGRAGPRAPRGRGRSAPRRGPGPHGVRAAAVGAAGNGPVPRSLPARARALPGARPDRGGPAAVAPRPRPGPGPAGGGGGGCDGFPGGAPRRAAGRQLFVDGDRRRPRLGGAVEAHDPPGPAGLLRPHRRAARAGGERGQVDRGPRPARGAGPEPDHRLEAAVGADGGGLVAHGARHERGGPDPADAVPLAAGRGDVPVQPPLHGVDVLHDGGECISNPRRPRARSGGGRRRGAGD